MDKTDLLFDFIEHPERYSPEEAKKFLNDPETVEIYRLMSDTSSALHGQTVLSDAETDARWKEFCMVNGLTKTSQRTSYRQSFFRRNAVAAAIAAVAVVAIAGGIGIVLKERGGIKSVTTIVNTSGKNGDKDDIHTPAVVFETSVPELPVSEGMVLFEDKSLSEVLERISTHYGVSVKYNSPERKNLRLYFRWDPNQDLMDAVESLNNFEQIRISVENKTLTVE